MSWFVRKLNFYDNESSPLVGKEKRNPFISQTIDEEEFEEVIIPPIEELIHGSANKPSDIPSR